MRKTCIQSLLPVMTYTGSALEASSSLEISVRRFTGINEITTEITSNIILLGPKYGRFNNIKSCVVDIRY